MSDLASIQNEIAAVKFIQSCFADEPNNAAAREGLIREKFTHNPEIGVYARFTEEELKERLRSLEDDLKSIRNERNLQFQVQIQGE